MFRAITFDAKVGCAPHFALSGSSMIYFQEEQLILEHFLGGRYARLPLKYERDRELEGNEEIVAKWIDFNCGP